MSLWADYKKEREGKFVVEREFGFFIYSFSGKDLYIEDIFVAQEYRRSKIATALIELAEEIAKLNKCERLLGTVVPGTNGETESLLFQLKIGFKLLSCNERLICLYREIK